MGVYKISLQFAFITFPFIAFLFTLPYLIYEYRKYGAVPFLKSAIIYSFMLYIICAYFLVILPLPTIEEISNYTAPKMQLVPFHFLQDIKNTTIINFDSIKSILNFFNKPSVFTVLFNILLTLPFGIYLKYLFNMKWFQVMLSSFILSLFFEITQLSGLYGIYPSPYRLFDVDDLIVNTTGGLIGYLISPILLMLIPSKKELDKQGYLKGQKVSLTRRLVALIIDTFFLAIFIFIFKIIFLNTKHESISTVFAIAFNYLIIPLFNTAKTIGQSIVKIQAVSNKDKMSYPKILFRNFILSFLILFPNSCIDFVHSKFNIDTNSLIIIILIFNLFNIFFYFFDDEHRFFYEWVSKTKIKSVIKFNISEKENVKSSENEVLENNTDENKSNDF